MVNEMTEALAGIDLYYSSGKAENLCEELGDVLLQVALLSQIAQEKGSGTVGRDQTSGEKEQNTGGNTGRKRGFWHSRFVGNCASLFPCKGHGEKARKTLTNKE